MFKNLEPKNQQEIFSFYAPNKERLRGILSIPHSGERVPTEFLPYLTSDQEAWGKDVDFRVDALVDIHELNARGVAVLVCHIHRVAVDLNRSPELAVLNWKENTQGTRLVVKEPNAFDKEKLLSSYYRPYYHMLKAILDEGLTLKRPFPVIDLHSMPSRPTSYHLKQNPQQKQERPDFCISNRHGKTSTPAYLDFLQTVLAKEGAKVWKNDPYVGGYITEWVGEQHTEMAQIEVKREVYMDESTRTLTASKIGPLQALLTQGLIQLFEKFGPST